MRVTAMAAMAVHMMQQGLLSLEMCTNVRIFTNFGAKPWRFCSDEECYLAVLVCSWMLLCADCWFPLALHFFVSYGEGLCTSSCVRIYGKRYDHHHHYPHHYHYHYYHLCYNYTTSTTCAVLCAHWQVTYGRHTGARVKYGLCSCTVVV